MQSRPRRIVAAIADALFESNDLDALVGDVFAFVDKTSLASRITFRLALVVIGMAPIVFFVSWRSFANLDRDRRQHVLARLERSPFGLALVAWRTLLMLHFFEDAKELARIGYREERKRHLAVIPIPTTSGVRLIADEVAEVAEEEDSKQGAA